MYSHMYIYIYIYVRAYRIQSNPEETIIFLGKAKEAPPAQKSEDVSPEAANWQQGQPPKTYFVVHPSSSGSYNPR